MFAFLGKADRVTFMIRKLLIAVLGGVSAVGGYLVPSVHAEDRGVAIGKALDGLDVKTPAKPRKMLVFSLTRGWKHKSIPTGNLMTQLMAEKTAAFDVVVSNDLSNFEPEKIKDFDAICFLNTTMEVFSPAKGVFAKMSNPEKKEALNLEKRLKKSLMEFIKSGKGFVGIHSATDTFYQWPEYGEMIGGYFNGHPWGAGSPVSVKVEDGQTNHACCAHLDGKNLEFKEEIYQFKAPYDPKKLQVLLRHYPEKMYLNKVKRKDKDNPVS
jgi:type 1 glutamine amidotransferase